MAGLAATLGEGASSGYTEVVVSDGPAEEVTVHLTTPSYFDVLGVEPTLGRSYHADEVAGAGAVVLSHRLWQRRYGGDPGVIGRTLQLETGTSSTIVGVMGPGFRAIGTMPDLWMAGDFFRIQSLDRRSSLHVIGRLRPGAAPREAQAEMHELAARLAEEAPEFNAGWDVRSRRSVRS